MYSELNLSNETVTINGHSLKKIYGGFGQGQPCILAKQVAELHGQELAEINRIVNNNLDWFEEGIDMINLAMIQNHSQHMTDFLLNFYTRDALNASKYIYLFSQQGYALLCKLLRSELAKQIYKQMVRDYFRMKEKFGESTLGNRITGERFDQSVKRFKVALEAVRLMGVTDKNRVRLIANEITKETTGVDLMAFILPFCSRYPERSKTTTASSLTKNDEENEILRNFVSEWRENHRENAVSSRQLYELIERNQIPMNLGTGSKRSQKVRLGKLLVKISGQQVGEYIVNDMGKHRNIHLWKLEKTE